jgi:hypothetical protein
VANGIGVHEFDDLKLVHGLLLDDNAELFL